MSPPVRHTSSVADQRRLSALSVPVDASVTRSQSVSRSRQRRKNGRRCIVRRWLGEFNENPCSDIDKNRGTIDPKRNTTCYDKLPMTDHEWVTRFAAQIQIALGPIAWSAVDDVPALAAERAVALPEPRNHAEAVILRSVLGEAAAKCGTTIHRRAHTRTPMETCEFTSAPFLESFWTASAIDPRRAFAAWAATFVPAFRQRHPRSSVERATEILCTRFAEAWTTRSLARAVAVGSATLARDFRRIHGMSIHEYLRLVRVAAALDQLADRHLGAIAVGVGYRSRKNLYSAIHRTVALTPSAFRALRGESGRDIVAQLRRRRSVRYRSSSSNRTSAIAAPMTNTEQTLAIRAPLSGEHGTRKVVEPDSCLHCRRNVIGAPSTIRLRTTRDGVGCGNDVRSVFPGQLERSGARGLLDPRTAEASAGVRARAQADDGAGIHGRRTAKQAGRGSFGKMIASSSRTRLAGRFLSRKPTAFTAISATT